MGAESFGQNAMNRFILCAFYFWLGCYVMSGIEECGRELDDEWKTVGHVTGLTAWVVCGGNLIVSCIRRYSTDAEVAAEPCAADKCDSPSPSIAWSEPATSAAAWAPSRVGNSMVVEDLEKGGEAPPGGWNTAALNTAALGQA